jgi:hypothetical protein
MHWGPELQPWHRESTQGRPGPHRLPQKPQFCGSDETSRQPVAQHWSVPVHTGPPLQLAGVLHTPSSHVAVGPQVFPQAPQLFRSVFSSTQEPLQPASGGAHVGFVQTTPPPGDETQHAPLWQFAPPAHRSPQPPQFEGSVLVSAQVEPQHVVPIGHPVPSHPLGTHWWVVGAHSSPAGHVSGDVRHVTQIPSGNSQYGVAGSEAQSTLALHPVGGGASMNGPPSEPGPPAKFVE